MEIIMKGKEKAHKAMNSGASCGAKMMKEKAKEKKKK
jgi:hypothetical protein